MKHWLWSLCALAGLADAHPPPFGPAAPPAAEPLGETFQTLDRDSDGHLALAELPARHALRSRFAEFDADGDQLIDRDEYGRFLTDEPPVAEADPDDAADDDAPPDANEPPPAR